MLIFPRFYSIFFRALRAACLSRRSEQWRRLVQAARSAVSLPGVSKLGKKKICNAKSDPPTAFAKAVMPCPTPCSLPPAMANALPLAHPYCDFPPSKTSDASFSTPLVQVAYGGLVVTKKKLAAPWSSQAVPHHSTNQALGCLTSEVGRDLVLSTRYGRQRPRS